MFWRPGFSMIFWNSEGFDVSIAVSSCVDNFSAILIFEALLTSQYQLVHFLEKLLYYWVLLSIKIKAWCWSRVESCSTESLSWSSCCQCPRQQKYFNISWLLLFFWISFLVNIILIFEKNIKRRIFLNSVADPKLPIPGTNYHHVTHLEKIEETF